MPKNQDIYTEITEKIINALENGTPPWRSPWTGGLQTIGFPLRSTSEPYRGINILMLWLTASDKDYLSQHWFTYKQAKTLGGQVRKGERATRIVYYSTLQRENDAGEDVTIPYLKTYGAFNADQIDDLPDEYYIKPNPPRDLGTKPDTTLDTLFAGTGAVIATTDEPRAYYRASDDLIHMPPIATFHDASGYYSTLAHEMVHWTGAKTRLDRQHERKRESYAFEELVAEIGACMVCAQIGVQPDYPQTAAYIENWLECLKQDRKAIFKAASLAHQACDYILKTQERAC